MHCTICFTNLINYDLLLQKKVNISLGVLHSVQLLEGGADVHGEKQVRHFHLGNIFIRALSQTFLSFTLCGKDM